MAKNKINLIVDECLLGEQQRNSVYEAGLELCQLMASKKNKNGESIIKQVWPGLQEFNWNHKPVLELQPLDRVGGEPGKSGVNVLAGHLFYSAKRGGNVTPSRQMIIKISPEPARDARFAMEKRQELIDEYDAVKIRKGHFRDRKRFARPLWIYRLEENKPVVLWAPFETPGDAYVRNNTESRWQFAPVVEMIKYLSAAWTSTEYQVNLTLRENKLDRIITALEYLSDAHSATIDSPRTKLNIVEHYDWELRHFMAPESQKGLWAKNWHELWGNKKRIEDFGKKWANPIIVCKKLSMLRERGLRTGYVHGDLHPRNIVFASNDEVRIIDFGWVRASQHIVKDFVLLEANLRFMTLPPFLPYDSVKRYLGWINSTRSPKNIHAECKLRIDLIKKFRETAQKHIGTGNNWDFEYVVPLFLVSLGLLKYCHTADCTWAARYNILRLSEYIQMNVLN